MRASDEDNDEVDQGVGQPMSRDVMCRSQAGCLPLAVSKALKDEEEDGSIPRQWADDSMRSEAAVLEAASPMTNKGDNTTKANSRTESSYVTT